jgi:hypothetical protein
VPMEHRGTTPRLCWGTPGSPGMRPCSLLPQLLVAERKDMLPGLPDYTTVFVRATNPALAPSNTRWSARRAPSKEWQETLVHVGEQRARPGDTWRGKARQGKERKGLAMASGDAVLAHIAELPASSVAELYKVRKRNRALRATATG